MSSVPVPVTTADGNDAGLIPADAVVVWQEIGTPVCVQPAGAVAGVVLGELVDVDVEPVADRAAAFSRGPVLRPRTNAPPAMAPATITAKATNTTRRTLRSSAATVGRQTHAVTLPHGASYSTQREGGQGTTICRRGRGHFAAQCRRGARPVFQANRR